MALSSKLITERIKLIVYTNAASFEFEYYTTLIEKLAARTNHLQLFHSLIKYMYAKELELVLSLNTSTLSSELCVCIVISVD